MTINHDWNQLRRQAATQKTIDFAGKPLPLKLTVSWGFSTLQTISTRLDQKRLELEGLDYKEVNVTAGLPKITLRFLNSDIKELVMPEDFLCPAAREGLEKAGERLILGIKNFLPDLPLQSKIATLFIAKDPEKNEFCGVLCLNR